MTDRTQAIDQLRKHLLRTSAPRLQMTLVLLLTAAVGFVASVLMLRLGVTPMAVRYPAALLLAYAAFVLLLRLWLAWQRHRGRLSDAASDVVSDVSLDLPSGRFRGGGKGLDLGGGFRGGGGSFGGSGAGGSWQGAAPLPQAVAAVPPASAPAGGPKLPGRLGDLDLDLDDGAILVVPLAVLAAVLASAYVVYAAPALFAELLLDGFVVTALYHRMRRVERRHWLRCVVRKTWLPALLTAAVFAVAGYLMQRAVPEALSIGPFWRAVTGP